MIRSAVSGRVASRDDKSSLLFNGTTSFGVIPHNTLVNPTAAMSLTARILPMNNNCRIIEKDVSGNRCYLLKIDPSNQVEFDFFSGTVLKQLVGGKVKMDVWQHIAVTYDGATAIIYIDGVNVASGALTGAIDVKTSTNIFLGSHGVGSEFFKGYMKGIGIYPAALTPAEVLAISSGKSIGTPNCYLRSNEQSGVLAGDASGNKMHAVLTNVTWSSRVPVGRRTQINPAYYLWDKFWGVDGTALDAHTPDTGAGWVQTASNSFYIQAQNAQANRKTDGDTAIMDSGFADLTVSADLTSYSDGTNVGLPGIIFRYTDSSNFWYCQVDSKNNVVSVYNVIVGVHTEMIRQGQTMTSGVANNIRISCKGKNITLWINQVEIVTYVSSVGSSATKVGIRYGKTLAGNTAIYGNFIAREFVGLVLDWPEFTEYAGNPVIPLGAGGTWDDKDINNPNICWDAANSRWVLTYSGYDGSGDNIQDCGFAYATNLLGPWTKDAGNPVIPAAVEDGIYAFNGGLVFLAGTWYLYYCSDNATTIRCATSPDLVTWTKQGIVLTHNQTWEGSAVFDCFARVREDGITIELWYAAQGTNRAIGYATSTNGLTFTKYVYSPVIPSQPSWSGTSNLGEPSVYVPAGKEGVEMLLSFDTSITLGKRYISQAITIDGGVTWHYRVGALKKTTGWMSNQVFDSFIIVNQGTMYLFHSGSDTDGGSLNLNIQLGVATATPRSLSTLIVST